MLKKIHLNAGNTVGFHPDSKVSIKCKKNFGPCETTFPRGKYKPAMSSEETPLRLLCSEKQFQIALTVHPRVLMLEINFLHHN